MTSMSNMIYILIYRWKLILTWIAELKTLLKVAGQLFVCFTGYFDKLCTYKNQKHACLNCNFIFLLSRTKTWLTLHSRFSLSCHLSSVVHSLTHLLRMQHLLGRCPADLNNSHKAQYPFSFYEPPVAVQGTSVSLYPHLPCVPSSRSFLI